MSKLYSPEKGILLRIDGIQFKTSLGYATVYGQVFLTYSLNGTFSNTLNNKDMNIISTHSEL